VLGRIGLAGMFDVGKLTIREAAIAVRAQLEPVPVSESIESEEISRQSEIRILRQVAAQ
jgi:hypothetical protein